MDCVLHSKVNWFNWLMIMSNTVTQVAFSGDVLSFQSCPQSTGGK